MPSTLALPLSGVRTPYSMRSRSTCRRRWHQQAVISPSRARRTRLDGLDGAERLLKFAASIKPKRLRSWCRTYHVHKKGRRAVRSRQAASSLSAAACVQKLRHSLAYTAGADLAVSLALNIRCRWRASRGRAFASAGGVTVRLADSSNVVDIALQGGMQIGIHRSRGQSLQISSNASI